MATALTSSKVFTLKVLCKKEVCVLKNKIFIFYFN